MRLQIKAQQINVTPDLRALVDKRLARLARLMNDNIVSGQMVLAREKNRYVAELTVHAKGEHILHGAGTTGSWGTSLTSAVSKVMQQAEKVKGKWKARKKG